MIPLRLAASVVPMALLCTGAHALPPANGSNCSANWVNNEGALECFIQGEDETNGGNSNPHHVACTAAGEIFCCTNNNRGGQTCEAVGGRARASVAQQLKAILNGQLAVMEQMRHLSERMDRLESHAPAPQGATPGSLYQPPARSGSPTARGGG